MTKFFAGKALPALMVSVALAGPALPAQAQDADARLRRLEAEVRAIKREIAPGSERTVAPQASPNTIATPIGTPASTPLSDLLTRVDALENQLTRLTAQNEEAEHRIRQLEARLAPAQGPTSAEPTDTGEPGSDPVVAEPAAATPGESASSTNLAAMTGGASTPASSPAIAAPSAQRLAAVKTIAKPQTEDPGDDEYSYGFRLWDAKFFPEAQQQLKLFLDKYPRHPRVSYARNLMGRALLDEGKPRDAATWFLQNYQADRLGARAPDSLLYLADSMRQLKDKDRACIALGEFSQMYSAEANGRLKGDYDRIRQGLTCN